MQPSVKIVIDPRLLTVLSALQDQTIIGNALEAGGLYLKGKLAVYPPQRRGKQPFKTDKQRKYFFFALKAGLIDVPYRRGMSPSSQRLSQRWDVQRSGLTVEVGTNVTYAPYVVGEKQSMYHKVTGWRTVEDVVRAEENKIMRQVELSIKQQLAARGG